MKSVVVDNIKILFNAKGKSSVDLFADACTKAAPLIYETWGLKPPRKCKIYIMTSWEIFILHGFSLTQKFSLLVLALVLSIVFPFAIPAVFLIVLLERRKSWSKIAGLTIPHHSICGIKSPDLVDPAGGKIGRRIYIEYANSDSLVQAAICHELTHAFSVHLDLPVWLNEGIAMYTVDKFIGKTTVKMETLKSIEAYPHNNHSTNYSNLMSGSDDSTVYTYARSYWLTQYLEHNYPGFIRSLLVKRQSHPKIEKLLSIKTGIPLKYFWNEIDQKIVAQFTS